MNHEQIDIFGNLQRSEDLTGDNRTILSDSPPKRSCRHTSSFLKKSIAFHKLEISRLQDENYKILIDGPGMAGNSKKKHSAAFAMKRIRKNEREIRKHLIIIQSYESELKKH